MKNSLKSLDQKKIVKYLLFAFVMALSLRYIPSNSISTKEIIMISAISSITFSIIDIISPSVQIIDN
jgi:hypothetical protein